MSERKIVVPEGMVEAVDKAISKVRGIGRDLTGGQVRDISLTEALRWLYDELDSLERKPYDDVLAHEYNACLADVRHIFLAPETEQESAYMRVTKAMGAVTLSEEEGNKILEFVKGAIHAGYRSSEPSVPEAVNDLLVKHINSEGALNGPEHKASDARYAHNAAVLEAYRRGQKVGSRA